jgi:chromosome segregation ATPase
MAVICCATPSELYLEETRSTLQFAQRAKLVRTNAQVNEVLDERSMIRRLQRELAEAKRHNSIPAQNQVRELEAQVANAGSQAMEAKAKLHRLKASILNAGYFFDQSVGDSKDGTLTSSSSLKKRRKSDGAALLNQLTPAKSATSDQQAPKTIPRETKVRMLERPFLPADQELALVQQALTTRNQVIRDLNATISGYTEELEKKNNEVTSVMERNSTLSDERAVACSKVNELLKVVASLESALEISIKEREEAMQDKEAQVSNSFELLQESMREKEEVKSKLEEMQKKMDEIQVERVRGAFEFAALTSERTQLLEERDADRARLQEMAGKTEFLTSNLKEATNERDVALLEIINLEAALGTKIEETSLLEEKCITLNANNEQYRMKTAQLEEQLVDSASANENLVSELQTSQSAIVELTAQICDLENGLTTLQKHCTSLQSTSRNERDLLEATVSDAYARITILENEKEETSLKFLETSHSNEELQRRLNEFETSLCELRREKEEISRHYQEEVKVLISRLEDGNEKLQLECAQREAQNAVVSSFEERLQLSENFSSDLQSTLETVQLEKSTVQAQIAVMEEELLSKDRKIQALQEARDLATAEKNSVQAVLTSCQMRLENLENQLTAAGEQIERLAEEKRDALADKEATLRTYEVQLGSYIDESEAKQTEIISLRCKICQLEEMIQEYGTLQMHSIEAEKTLRSEIQDMQTSIDINTQAKHEVEQQLSAARYEISSLIINLEKAHDEITKANKVVCCLRDDVAEKESDIRQLKSDEDEATKHVELRLKDVNSLCSEREVELKQARMNFTDLEAKTKLLDDESQSLRESTARHLDQIRELQSELRSCEISVAAKDAAYAELEVSNQLEMNEQKRLQDESLVLVKRQQMEIDKIQNELSECSGKLGSKIVEMNSLEFTLVSQKAIVADLENAVGFYKSKSMEDQKTLKRLIDEKEEASVARMILERECEEAVQSARKKEEDLENLRMMFKAVRGDFQVLESDLISVKRISSEQQETIQELIKEKEEMCIKCRNLEEESSVDFTTRQEEIEKLQKFNRDLVERYEDEMNDLQKQIETVFEEATSLERQKKELEFLVNELHNDVELMQKKSFDFEGELEKSFRARDDIERCLRDRESERDEATAEVERLYERSRELTKSLAEAMPKEKATMLLGELSDLKSENTELKLLLASVNDSEERLRTAVFTADNKFKANAAELEGAIYRISQLEEELSQYQRTHADSDTNSPSLTEIENLRSEKVELERLLFVEKESRNAFEDNLKKQMGEEQRVLLQEGESMMSTLRAKIDDCEVRIQRSESEAYTARQQAEEINDEKNNLEEKLLEAQEQVEGVNVTMQQQKTQITLLQSELNITKSECYSLKESVIDMKEKLRRFARDSEKAARESEMASSEAATLRRKLSSMETQLRSALAESQKLKKKIQIGVEHADLITQLEAQILDKDKEIERVSLKIAELEKDRKKILEKYTLLESGTVRAGHENLVDSKEIEKLGEAVANLKGEITMKNEQMKVKDQRIQKLEATRLTKGQLETIKKNKVRHNFFLAHR